MFINKKNGLEDPFFRRLKLITWTILMKSKLLIYILGTLKHVFWDIDSHQANKLLFVKSPVIYSLNINL